MHKSKVLFELVIEYKEQRMKIFTITIKPPPPQYQSTQWCTVASTDTRMHRTRTGACLGWFPAAQCLRRQPD
jgi:hypothetical protein